MPSKRPHTKSRLGCGQCKRRRIRCDEAAPCCSSCTKKGIECEYRQFAEVPGKIRAMMQQDSTSLLSQPKIPSLQCPPAEHLDASISSSFAPKDFLLMHQYSLNTSLTIGILDDDSYHSIWQTRVPVLACQHRYLLHAILSITAAHMSDVSSSRYHYSAAIEAFSSLGSVSTSDEQDSVFCYCVLMMLTTFALDCVKAKDLEACVAGLTGGFRMIRTAVSLLATFQNDLREREVGRLLRHVDSSAQVLPIPDEVRVSLARLDYLIGTQRKHLSVETSVVLRRELENLRQFYTKIPIKPSSWVNMLQWPKTLSTDFLTLLENNDPAALTMVAHWCVPLHHAPQKWFAADWPTFTVLAVADRLKGGVWHEALAWPVASIMSTA